MNNLVSFSYNLLPFPGYLGTYTQKEEDVLLFYLLTFAIKSQLNNSPQAGMTAEHIHEENESRAASINYKENNGEYKKDHGHNDSVVYLSQHVLYLTAFTKHIRSIVIRFYSLSLAASHRATVLTM